MCNFSLCLNKKTHSRPKKLYCIANWPEYEKALVELGSLTFWLSEDFSKVWLYAGEKQKDLESKTAEEKQWRSESGDG